MAFPTARPIALQTFWQLWPRRAVQQVHQQNQIPSDPFRLWGSGDFRSVMEVDFVPFLPGFSENSIKVLMMLHLCWKFEKHENPTGVEFHQRLERTAEAYRAVLEAFLQDGKYTGAARSKGVHTSSQRSQLAAKAWQTTGLTASWRAGVPNEQNKTIWPWTSKHTAVYPNASPIVDFETTDPGF